MTVHFQRATKGISPKVLAIDFEPIRAAALKGGMSLRTCNRRIVKLQCFYTLVLLYPNQPISPDEDADKVWHYHILNTPKYRKDCHTMFGYFLDHCPDEQIVDPSIEAAYEQLFGEPMKPRKCVALAAKCASTPRAKCIAKEATKCIARPAAKCCATNGPEVVADCIAPCGAPAQIAA